MIAKDHKSAYCFIKFWNFLDKRKNTGTGNKFEDGVFGQEFQKLGHSEALPIASKASKPNNTLVWSSVA